MTDVAIVTTTINYPPKTFSELARAGHLVVAGDLKTPPETGDLVHQLGGTYLAPDDQGRWRISEVLGWNTIQRRNVAFLEAARLGADVVVTVDDDNCPDDAVTWAMEHQRGLDRTLDLLWNTTSGWFNPGSLLSPPVYARGMPYHIAVAERGSTDRYSAQWEPGYGRRVGVNCGLWLGDPDVDALQRIANRPETESLIPQRDDSRTIVQPGVWSPINSQNTAWRPELLPLAVVLPFVGRWDDILGGYLAEWSLWATGYVVAYGKPLVRQDRNDHDLWRDLDLELDGIKRTPQWCDALGTIQASGDPITDLSLFADFLHDNDELGFDSRITDFLRAWIADWRALRST